MKAPLRQVRDELRHALGLQEGPVDTGTVLTTPSSVTKAQAVHSAKNCALRGVLRDIGAVAVRELANELGVAGLRPADYSEHEEVARVLKDRVLRALTDDTDGEFARSVREHLRMRG